MDSFLGEIGKENIEATRTVTISDWEVQPPIGVPHGSGYNCFYGHQCPLAISSSTTSRTTPAPTPGSSRRKEGSDSKAVPITLGILIPLIFFLGVYLLFRLYLKNRRRTVPQGPRVTNAPQMSDDVVEGDVLIDIIRAILASHDSNARTVEKVLDIINKVLDSAREAKEQPSSSTFPSTSQEKTSSQKSSDQLKELKELLTCPICIDIFIDPVSIITAQTTQNNGCCMFPILSIHTNQSNIQQ